MSIITVQSVKRVKLMFEKRIHFCLFYGNYRQNDNQAFYNAIDNPFKARRKIKNLQSYR